MGGELHRLRVAVVELEGHVPGYDGLPLLLERGYRLVVRVWREGGERDLGVHEDRRHVGVRELGVVEPERAALWAGALIGVAPLISGSVAVLAMGQWVFGVGALGEALQSGQVEAITVALVAGLAFALVGFHRARHERDRA